MSTYGCYVKFTLQPGQRDTFVNLMRQAAEEVEAAKGCELYIINTSPTEPDVVWVTELWQSQADQAASLSLESTRTLITQVMPLLAGAPEKIDLQPVGGKGLPPK